VKPSLAKVVALLRAWHADFGRAASTGRGRQAADGAWHTYTRVAVRIVHSRAAIMNPEPFAPDVILDVYFEGQIIQSIHLDPAAFAQAALGEANRATVDTDPDRKQCTAHGFLPRSGSIRVNLHLQSPLPPGLPDPGLPTRTTYFYDANTRVTAVAGDRTTFVYLAPPARRPEPPPDDPQIIG
jgi:hypothetical protein